MARLEYLLIAWCLHTTLAQIPPQIPPQVLPQNPRERCAIDYGCFDNCNLQCDFLVYWTLSDDDVTYHLTSTVVGPETWMLFGMADDVDMTNDSVIGCKVKADDGTARLLNGVLTNGTFTAIEDTAVVLVSGTVEGPFLHCHIQRPTDGDEGTLRKNSTQPWIYFFDKGPVNDSDGSLITFDFTTREFSAQRLSSSDLTILDNGMVPDTNTTFGVLSPDWDCGVTKGCFSQCDSMTSCSILVTWNQTGSDVVYQLSTSLSGRMTAWVLLAFSDDKQMGEDYVMGCTMQIDGTFTVFTGVNAGGKTPPTFINDTDVTLESSGVADDVMTCTLRRPISEDLTVERRDTATDWFYLAATGTVDTYDPDLLNYHWKRKAISAVKLNSALTVYDGGPTSSDISVDSACGVTKGCMYSCDEDDTCAYLVTWTDQGDTVRFHLATRIREETGSYVAIGFSYDTGMGDDSVIGCANDDWGRFVLYNSFNVGEESSVIEPGGSILVSHTFANGTMTCTFDRAKNTSFINRQLFDLDQPWYLLLAVGKATLSSTPGGDPDLKQHHSVYSTGETVMFNETSVLIAQPSSNDEPLVLAHGCLMVGAWLFFASVGLVVARHCKPIWTDLIFSQKTWFQIHRTSMVIVMLATVAGTVCIFVEEKEWSSLDNEEEYLQSHPILGVIVTALVIINPLMALCRPKPGSTGRSIFNWAHWLVGEAAHIMGVIAIFFGVELYDDAPDSTSTVLWVYVGWQILVEIMLYLVTCCSNKKRSEAYEMDANGEESPKVTVPNEDTDTGVKLKRVILLLHFFVVSVLSSTVVTLMAQGK